MSSEIVVVGGGIGGLTAAALLAKQGCKVLVLEASREWGGCAGKFSRGDYLFPVGATLGMGFEAGGIHQRIFQSLNIPFDALQLEEVMRIHLPTRSLTFYRDRSRHVAEICKAFPKHKENIQKFYHNLYSIAAEIRKLMGALPILPPKTMKEWLLLARSMKFTTPKLLPFFPKTLENLLCKHQLDDVEEFVHFIDGQLIDSMQTTSEHCSLLLGCLALDIYHEGAFYVEGGLYKVAEALVSNIQQNGGTTKLGRKVTKLEKNNESWIVYDHRGNMYETDHVIFNTPIHALEQLMDSNIYATLPIKTKERSTLEQWGAFTLYIALKDELLPENVPLFQQVLIDDNESLSNGNHLFLSLSHEDDRLRAPKGSRTLTVSTHVPLDDWKNNETYLASKEAMVEKMLDGIEKVIPSIRDSIIQLIPGSPRAWEKFTFRRNGEVGGFPQTPQFALFKSISHRTSLKGLWLCGDSVFPGAGTIGASVSGYHVYHSITGGKLPYIQTTPQS